MTTKRRPTRWTGRRAARKTEYKGVLYDSKAEAAYARLLDACVHAGALAGWERQVPVRLTVHGLPWRAMRVDFRVLLPDGTRELHEVKGYPEEVWRMKREVYDLLYEAGVMKERYVVVSAKTLEPVAKRKRGRTK